MKTKEFDVDAYLAGEIALPGNFDTGFRRDLDLAREIVRERHTARSGGAFDLLTQEADEGV